MNKEQTLHAFWSQFGVKAYEENTVISEDEMIKRGIDPYPRITYEVAVDSFGQTSALSASIWDRSSSWESVSTILHRIGQTLSYGGQELSYDGGAMWIKKGVPFARHMSDVDDSIRRIVLNIEVEYLSEV